MEGDKGIVVIPSGGGEIAIPILVSAQAADTSVQGCYSRHSATSESGSYPLSGASVEEKASTGKSTDSQKRRRRPSSNISELDSTVGCELQLRNLLDVVESNPTSPNLAGQSSEWRATSSIAKNSLSKKMMSMRADTLPAAEENGGGDDDTSDDSDDDEEEEEQQKSYQKYANTQRLKSIGKKLKAIDVIIEWIVFICAMAMLIASLYAHNLKARIVWGLEIWKWCVLVAVIFCGRLVTKWAKDAIVFLIESKFLFNERVVDFFHGVKQSVRVVIWLALVLLAWVLLIDRGVNRSKETTKILNYVTKALVSSLVGAVMWMVKTLLVKLITGSFLVKTFSWKIREAISDEYVLWTLSVPPSLRVEENGGNSWFSTFCCLVPPKWWSNKEKKEETEVQNKKRMVRIKTNHAQIMLKKLGKIKPGKKAAYTTGLLIGRIISAELSIVSSALNDSLDGGGEQKDITSRSEAEEAASLIFDNVSRRGK